MLEAQASMDTGREFEKRKDISSSLASYAYASTACSDRLIVLGSQRARPDQRNQAPILKRCTRLWPTVAEQPGRPHPCARTSDLSRVGCYRITTEVVHRYTRRLADDLYTARRSVDCRFGRSSLLGYDAGETIMYYLQTT
jgi:hypothetical protein